MIFISVKVVAIFVRKNGGYIFHLNLGAVFVKIKHSNITVLLTTFVFLHLLRIYHKLCNGVTGITLALKHNDVSVRNLIIVTAEHKEYVFMLAHKFFPHFNAVVKYFVEIRVWRICFIIDPRTISGKIGMSSDYNTVCGICFNYLTCPC